MNVRQAVAWMPQPRVIAGIRNHITRNAVQILIEAVTEGGYTG